MWHPNSLPSRLLLAVVLIAGCALLPGSIPSQEPERGSLSAGITDVGSTRYPGNGLRYIDGYTGPAVLSGVTRTARFPGTGHVLVLTGNYPTGYSWFDAGTPSQVPRLVSQGTLPDVSGPYVRHVAFDGPRSCLYIYTDDSNRSLWKFTLGAVGGEPQLVGRVDLPQRVAALAVDEVAGELVVVFANAVLAKYAVGGNSALPVLVGSAALTPPVPISADTRGAAVLVDSTSRVCLVVAGVGVYPCNLGDAGSPPTANPRIVFAIGQTFSAASWVNPGQSALVSTTGTSSRRLTRVDIPSPGATPLLTQSEALTTPSVGFDELDMDPAAGRAWQVGSDVNSGSALVMRRIDPGTGNTPPTVEAEWINPTGSPAYGNQAVLDRFHVISGTANAFFLNDNPDTLFGVGGACLVAAVALDTPGGSALGIQSTTFGSASKPVQALAHDPASGYSYAIMTGPTRSVAKFRSPDAGAPVDVAGQMDLSAHTYGFYAMKLNPATRVGYLLGYSSILKVDLGAGASPPTLLSELPLLAAERPITNSFILDHARGYGYYASYDQAAFQWQIRKLRLGTPGDPMQIVSSLPIPTAYYGVALLGFDEDQNRLIVGTEGSRVAYVEAGVGDAAPTFGESVLTGSYQDYSTVFSSAAFDPLTRTLQFGSNRYIPPPRPYGYGTLITNPQLVRVAIPGDGSAPVLRSNLEMGWANFGITSMVASPRDGRAWSALAAGNKVVQFDIDDDQTTGTAEIIIPGPVIIEPRIATYDDDSGIAMFACTSSRTYSTTFFRVATRPSLRGAMRGTRFRLEGHAQVTHANLWSHADWGSTRLAIYTDANPRVLLWDSGTVSITADESAQSVAIASGTPSGLAIGPGDYWLCWQVDTAAGVPSYAPGEAGDSFELPMSFGAPPNSFPASAATETADLWTAWVSLNGASSAASWDLYQ